MYESDLTKFMREFLAQHPEEIESQKQGRAIWWDKSPEERSPVPSMHHAPKAGGSEHIFAPISPDDDAPAAADELLKAP